MNKDFLNILENIEREKGISIEILFQAVESALVSAARKVIGKKTEDISVKIDRKNGQIKVFSEGKEIESGDFGRIAAQTAKQVIIQKIREAERDVIYGEFHEKMGDIVSGSVHRFERGDIILDLGKTEAILPKSQQCHKESYRQGDRVRAYLLDVKKTPRGPQIIVSRSNPGFIKKLFELEVPEIGDGIVEIKSIYREAGDRTKVAVFSKDDKVDAVGACVGMRGQRVKSIVREIHGERLDIIRWSDDIQEYAKASLSPAEVSKIKVDKERRRLEVIVKDDQLSLAIGKHGQNVRIASKLVGWDIDIRSEKRLKELKSKEKEPKKETKKAKGIKKTKEPTVANLGGVGKKTYGVLVKAGFDSIEKIAGAKTEDITKLEGIGTKTAEKIINSAKEKVKK
ncbi:MAG: transcription termination/antitermination protein NusA [Candidatus Omnitrophica bacterium]|nr:transcription termination/antitermination protein NusA [Candidatus Omnitrophota bacterium]